MMARQGTVGTIGIGGIYHERVGEGIGRRGGDRLYEGSPFPDARSAKGFASYMIAKPSKLSRRNEVHVVSRGRCDISRELSPSWPLLWQSTVLARYRAMRTMGHSPCGHGWGISNRSLIMRVSR